MNRSDLISVSQLQIRGFINIFTGVEMLPVYLLISGNFRKWQVKNIDACRWWQVRKPYKYIFICFSTWSHCHSCSSRTVYVATRLYSIEVWWCNLCSEHDQDSKCVLLSSFFANQAWARNMDHFLTCKQCAKEAEGWRSTHRREFGNNNETFCASIQVQQMNKWKDGHLWLSAEDGKMFCSYCKEVDKTSRNKFISGCELMRILLSISLLLMIVQPQLNFKKWNKIILK